MLSNKYFGSYYPVKSIIHKLSSIIKLICLLLFLIPIIGSMSLKLHIVILFFLIMIIYSSNVPIRFYTNMLYGLRYVYIFLLFLLASKGLSLENAVIVLIKITCFIEYLAYLFYTTSPSELKYAIEKCLNPFNFLNINLARISNTIIMLITFFPILFTTEKKVLKSASSRGLDYFHGDILSRMYASISSFKNTLRLTIEKIKRNKEASVLKMYKVNKFRTNLRTNKIGFYDVIFLLVHFIFIAYYIWERGIL